MAKTTIELADDLVSRARSYAAKEKTTLRALVERGLHAVLAADASADRFQLQDASVGGRGLRTEFQSTDWRRIRDAAYEGRGG